MDLEDLNLNLLPSLDALLRERNVSAAARKMGVSQSAMSHALAKLRSLLGDPLLVVSGRTMVATPRAERLANTLPSALASLKQALAEPRAFDPATATKHFRLATYDYFEVTTLPHVLEYLRAKAPGVRLDIERLDARSPARLVNGEIDFVMGGESMTMPSTLMRRVLYRDPFKVIARPDHPLISCRLSLKRYLELDHLLISVEGRATGLVDRVLAEQGKSRRVGLRLPHFGSAAQAVCHSDMICTIASTIAEQAQATHGLQVFTPPISLPPAGVVAWWPPQHQGDPARQWFRESILQGDALSPTIQRLIKALKTSAVP